MKFFFLYLDRIEFQFARDDINHPFDNESGFRFADAAQ